MYLDMYALSYIRSSTENRDDILCQGILDMMEDEFDEGDASAAWTDMIDRRGLFKVNDRAYAFFVSVETVVRQYFQIKKAVDLQAAHIKDKLVSSALDDSDVKLHAVVDGWYRN